MIIQSDVCWHFFHSLSIGARRNVSETDERGEEERKNEKKHNVGEFG
jgi:hypothetical protein